MIRTTIGALLCAAALSLSSAGAQTAPQPLNKTRPEFLPGYLPKGAAPDSAALLAPAPAIGSATQARDDAASKAALGLNGGPRWALAAQDADMRFPAAAETFACALGIGIGTQATPRLYTLLRRTLADAGLSTYPAKTRYSRPRPFVANGAPICTPEMEKWLRADGSYPSGHAAVGWAWALILAEAAPDRADALLARGRAFERSRMVCNVHWLSDTEAGAVVGAAVVARLHADPDFRADLEAARGEIAAARAAGRRLARDCAAEAEALALDPDRQP